MNNLEDLNIEQELLPLFDSSQNTFTKDRILKLLKTPLTSVKAIENRQQIFKGYTLNQDVLKGYSYSISYLNQVYYFLNKDTIDFNFKHRFLAKRKSKSELASKCSQLILFFHRLETDYFSKLNLDVFPKTFRFKIEALSNVLSHFKLQEFKKIIQRKGLKHKNLKLIIKTIFSIKNDGSLLEFWDNLFLFEAYLSLNKGICKQGFKFPHFVEKGIKLRDFHHPLLSNPVKNNFESQTNVILLNGPNMSGKSTFLKAISICIYLGHLGLAIPATAANMPFFNCFSVAINRKDNLNSGYSHFMSEIRNLKNVVLNANNGKTYFAVFDELFNGTNIEDTLEICKTTLKGLTAYKNSFFIISTHIQELQNVEHKDISNYYLDCSLVNNIPSFSYTLKKGWSDIKIGRILFETEGLNQLLK